MAGLEKSVKELGIATAMIMEEKPGYARPATYIRERGSFTSKGDLVYADTPSALDPMPHDAMPNRLGLAEWLVSDDNPLTARVAVNHFWETHLRPRHRRDAEDFGTQGDPPSHPELLDWLATEFMHQGWSMKKIQRLIVTSATYRQSSQRHAGTDRARSLQQAVCARSALPRGSRDGARHRARRRRPAEPEDVRAERLPPAARRHLGHAVQQRSTGWRARAKTATAAPSIPSCAAARPIRAYATFDAPSREFCTVRRVRTNTPLQALTALNDPYFFDAPARWPSACVTEGGATNADRATLRLSPVRVAPAPSQGELDRVLGFYEQQLAVYQSDHKAALEMLGATQDVRGAPELAAWTMVANVLLNLDETMTKE